MTHGRTEEAVHTATEIAHPFDMARTAPPTACRARPKADVPESVLADAGNDLIALLSRRDRMRLLATAKSVQLEPGAVLCEPGETMRHVYFPIDCSISLLTRVDGKPGIGVGMVGREGMLGVQVVLGLGATPLHALVQSRGTAWRIGAAQLRRELDQNKTLRRTLSRYLCVRIAQLAASAACVNCFSIGQRLARWLLMSQDRAPGDTLHLIQEHLANMLGARRAGITCAAGDLQQRGLIRYHRGEITVLNRAGLEAAAGGCYAGRNTFDRMVN